jgi:hypothetical protein
MIKHHSGLAATLVAALSCAALPAHADVLDLPVSAGFMNSSDGSGCQINGWPKGIGPKELGATCDFEFPVTIPVGHTIQQIEIVHAAGANAGAFITAFLGTVDFVSSSTTMQFQWLSNAIIPAGSFVASPLMKQVQLHPSGVGYPDAFVVQPNTMYRVVLHLEDGGDVTGLRITYQ